MTSSTMAATCSGRRNTCTTSMGPAFFMADSRSGQDFSPRISLAAGFTGTMR
jgi:hypothetical protein